MGDRRRQADRGADHDVAVDPGLGEQLLDEAAGGREAVLDAVPVLQGDPAAGEDPVAEVADGDGEVAGADVDADGRARRAVEAYAAGGTAAASRRWVGPVDGGAGLGFVERVVDDPEPDQLAEQVRDGRP